MSVSPYRTQAATEMETSDAMLDALDAIIDEALTHVEDEPKRDRLKRAFAGAIVAYARLSRSEEEVECMNAANEALAAESAGVFDQNWELHQ